MLIFNRTNIFRHQICQRCFSTTNKDNHILKKLGDLGKNKKQIFDMDEIDSQKQNFVIKKKIKENSPRKMSRKTNAFKFLKQDMREIDQNEPFGKATNV